MHTIATIVHGSHLFGTATETSDFDRKSVVVPHADKILLGRIGASWIEGTKIDPHARNTSSDEDHEFHDLLRFVNLLADGQPVAIEMLFAPEKFHLVEAAPTWRLLRDNVDRVISKEASKFAGYCRRQAVAYSVKGDRLRSAERVAIALTRLVEANGRRDRLRDYMPALIEEFGDDEYVTTSERTMANGQVIDHLCVCNRLVPVTVNLGDALRMVEGVVGEYGKRAQAAMASGGHDWKALSHAVRIGYEALELFGTGSITFPLTKAPRLLAIKKGLVGRDEVTDEIGTLLGQVERAAAESALPNKADIGFLESVVADAHRDAVMTSWQSTPAP